MANTEIKKILVIQLRQIGDVLLCTPALRALRSQFPAAKIAFLVDKPFEPLLRHNPDLDLVLQRDPDESFGAVRTILRIRKFSPDLVIDYFANPRTAVIALLSGAKLTLSYANKPRSFFYKIKAAPAGAYVGEEKLSLLKPLGIESRGLDLVFNYPKQADARTSQMLEAANASSNLVVLDLFHKRPARQWPTASFIELADRLAENFSARVIITCLAQNRGRAEQAVAGARQKHSIASDLNLYELAALIRRARLFIGGDAGAKHIAVSQKTPTFTILGPSGGQWTPDSPIHETASVELDCRPCAHHICPKPEHLCQTSLTQDMAWEKLSGFISARIKLKK